jgi:hypothetical protein
VETHTTGSPEDPHLADTAEAVLTRILSAGRRDEGVSAHQAIRDAQTGATSLAVLGPIWEDTVADGTSAAAIQILDAARTPGLAAAALADAAWPALLAVLHQEATNGTDVGELLAAAIEERGFDDAHGVSAVLHYRITKRLSNELITVSLAADMSPAPVNETATLLTRRTYRQRTPAGESPDLVVARQAADLLDARIDALRAKLETDPPEWTIRLLGRPPADLVDRDHWTRRAVAVAAYRERYQISTSGVADGDATLGLLGPRPHPHRAEAALMWSHAHDALGEASELTRLRAAPADELRTLVAAGTAARAAEPAYAGDELRTAARELRIAQAAEAELSTRIEFGRSSGPSKVDIARLADELAAQRRLTAAAYRRYDGASVRHREWQAWDHRTAAVRRTERLAAELLASQEARSDATHATPSQETWLADLVAGERTAAAHAAVRTRQRLVRTRTPLPDEEHHLRSPARPDPERGLGR